MRLERLHADPPLAWRVMDPERPEQEAKARADRQRRPGRLSDDEARRRVNPAEMKEWEIYPDIWDQPENVESLLQDLRRLRETVSNVAGRGLGILVSVS